jgi:hypothetical protein
MITIGKEVCLMLCFVVPMLATPATAAGCDQGLDIYLQLSAVAEPEQVAIANGVQIAVIDSQQDALGELHRRISDVRAARREFASPIGSFPTIALPTGD